MQNRATRPIAGYALPVIGGLLFVDHTWNKKLSTTIGYSMVDIVNAATSAPSSFDTGGYGTANVLFHPVQNVQWGVELHYGSRGNFTDGWDYNAVKVQVSFKYGFSHTLYRPRKI